MRRAAGTALLIGAIAVGAGVAFHGRDASAPRYITAPVERGVIATVVKATGHVEAVNTVDVGSQLSGQIAKVLVGFNDTVRAGQAIAELDRGIFLAHVNEAEAAVKVAGAKTQVQKASLGRARSAVLRAGGDYKLAEDQVAGAQIRQSEAERELQRKLELARTGSVPDREVSQVRAARDTAAADLRAALDQVAIKVQTAAMAEAEVHMAEADLANAEAMVEQQQAAVDQARLDLDRTVLRSPIDGVVIKRDVNPGQTVAVTLEAKTLFTIANDLSRMEVHGRIDEADIGQIREGQAVRFTVDAYPQRSFTGTVLQIRKAPESKQDVVTYTVIISAANPDFVLFPGMTASLHITVARTAEVLQIPAQALGFRPPADNGAPEKRPHVAAASEASATIWVLDDDGKLVPIAISTGFSDDNAAEIRSGPLHAGQAVIVGIANSQPRSSFFGLRLGF